MAEHAGPVLVTGASGFVGQHLVAALGARAVPCHARVADADALRDAIAAAAPVAVVHLAAQSSVADSWASGHLVWEVNALGTVNVLHAVAAAAPDARVVVASSAEVYGRADAGTALAEDAPVAPVSPYGASKAAVEIACDRARRTGELDVVVLRPFPQIGPGQDARFAVGSWARQIAGLELAGGGELLIGDVSVRRDLTDVRDGVRAYAAVLDPAVAGGTYNVASGRAVALGDVVGLLQAAARVPVEVRLDEARVRPNDLPVLYGDASRLRAACGWEPQIPLEQTVRDALEAARVRLRQERA